MSPSRIPPDPIDDDPVIAEYTVYITPPLSPPKSEPEAAPAPTFDPANVPTTNALYLLQFPTRDRTAPYNAASANTPLSIRFKPTSGFVELDVPIAHSFNYNEPKASAWSEALARAGPEGWGAAGGFMGRPAGSAREDEPAPQMGAQTLGGLVTRPEKGGPVYMVGAFRGEELHLTPVGGVVQLRPQFHHLDAAIFMARSGGAGRGAAGAGFEVSGGAASGRAQPRGAKSVHLQTRAGEDGVAPGASAKELLQAAWVEPWVRLRYHDEEDTVSYEAYHDRLLGGEEGEEGELVAGMSGSEYLERISGRRPVVGGKSVVVNSDGSEGEGDEIDGRDVEMADA